MIGDMKKDYEGARANGIVSLGACYGYCREDKTNFDFYISTPSDLLNFLSCGNTD
jgi:phosphoglycolate phosphatase-like HAD superfamily hydrolase